MKISRCVKGFENAMPDRDVETIPPTMTPAYNIQGQAFEGRRDLIYYQYAKIIAKRLDPR